MKKGKIIVIEGTDCSGKGTQTKLLVERFKRENIPIQAMNFPRYQTPTGRIIGQCYLGKPSFGQDILWFGDPDKVDPKIASLYYAADRLAAKPEIIKIISSGTHLILDRYYQSNMAHQGGKIKNPEERKDLLDILYKIELESLKIPKEDATIFLHMPTPVALKLREERNEKPDGHEKNMQHLERAEKTYLYLCKHFNWVKVECAPNNLLRTLEDIHEEVYSHVKNLI